jgi:putative FmdB family regulatory protein
MPLFEFLCNACGDRFETLVLGSSQPSCPRCNATDLAKQLSAFAFRSGTGAGSSSGGAGSRCSGCAGGSCSTCH